MSVENIMAQPLSGPLLAQCANCGAALSFETYGPPINDGTWFHNHNGLVWCIDLNDTETDEYSEGDEPK